MELICLHTSIRLVSTQMVSIFGINPENTLVNINHLFVDSEVVSSAIQF